MKKKEFRIISFLIPMIMGVIVVHSISIGNPILAVGSVFAGMIVMYLSKHRLNDIVEDERIRQISQKASGLLFNLLLSALPLEEQPL